MLSIITTFNPRAQNICEIHSSIQTWINQEIVSDIFIYGVSKYDYCGPVGKVRFIDKTGLPKISEIINFINENAVTEYVAYINSDIHIIGDLQKLINTVKPKDFLITGWRLDIATREIIYSDVENIGCQQIHGGMDYFIFPRGCFSDFPAYYIGKGMFDYAFIWYAFKNGYIVYNSTKSIKAYHVIHNLNNISSDYHSYYRSKEYLYNKKLISYFKIYLYSLFRAKYLIIDYKVVPNNYINKLFPVIFEYISGVIYQLILPHHKTLKPLLFYLGKLYRLIFSVFYRY